MWLRVSLPRASPLLVAVTCVVVVLLLLRPLLFHPGLPGFNHDWAWPPSLEQTRAMLAASLHPYVDRDYGAPNFYMGAAGLWALATACSALFGVVAGLRVVLLVVMIGAFGGAFTLARRLGAGTVAAAAIATIFCASPVVANEFAAGHVAYLFSYACLPWIFLCALSVAKSDRPLSGLLGVVVLAPLAAAQPQFLVFNALSILAASLFARDARQRVLVGACALFAFAASPYTLSLAIFGHPYATLGADRVTLHWETANSSSFGQVLVGAGYPQGYDRLAAHALLDIRVVGGAILWLLAILGALSRAALWVIVAAALIAAEAIAGTNGILAGVLDWSFLHIPAMALFRELYHFSGPLVLALCVCASVARVRLAAALALLGAVAYVAAQLTGGFWSAVGWYDPRPFQHVAQRIALDRTGGYALYVPLLQPMGRRGGAPAGADVDAFSIGTHPSLSEFVPTQPLSQLDFLLRHRPHDLPALLRSLGIEYVIVRPQWRSAYFAHLEPSLRGLVRRHGVDRENPGWIARGLHVVAQARGVVVARVPGVSGIVRDRVSGKEAPFYHLAVAALPLPSATTADPRRGWVEGTTWQWWSSKFAGPINPGVFSIRRRGTEMFPGRVEKVPAEGMNHGCSHVARAGNTFRVFPSGCENVGIEVLALRGSGWVLRDKSGNVMTPIDRAWDLQWIVPRGGAPYRLARQLPAPLEIGLALQYLVWTLAVASAIALLALIGTRCEY